MKNEIYRHYGHNKFIKDKFIPIFNKPYSNKPGGGLWACPTNNVDIDWKSWCKREEFCLDKLKEHFDFKIKDSANILEIKDIKDLDKLPRIKQDTISPILDKLNMITDVDFETLSKDYDGMIVWMYRSSDIDNKTRYFDGIYYRLYGWDVDTLLVFNPNIIEEV